MLRKFAPKTCSWDAFTGVETTRRFVKASKGGGHYDYPVTLTGPSPVEVAKPLTLDKARRIGEEVARFTGLAITDATMGQVSRREADSVDEPARDRFRR